MSNNPIASHIAFDMIEHPYREVIVTLAEAPAFQENNICRLARVIWAEGSCIASPWSYGKLWYFGGTNIVSRIGAGASGDLTVWEHPVAPHDRKAVAALVASRTEVAA